MCQQDIKLLGKITKQPALLGESPIWDHRNNSLLWIDIEGKMLHQYSVETATDKSFPLPKKPGTVVPTQKQWVVLLALEDTVSYLDMNTNAITNISGPGYEGKPVRFNDGKCDALGNFWIGTVDTKNYNDPIAKLYRFDAKYQFAVEKEAVSVSNGISWSPDGKKMYYIDSPTRTVIAYDVNTKTGNISNPTTIIHTPQDLGTPDGSTIDAEGMLWVAQWGGACVMRWDPQTGKLLAKVAVPARNITAMAFGGKDLDILYITTAKIAMSPEDEELFPDAGNIFYCKPGCKGIPAKLFSK